MRSGEKRFVLSRSGQGLSMSCPPSGIAGSWETDHSRRTVSFEPPSGGCVVFARRLGALEIMP